MNEFGRYAPLHQAHRRVQTEKEQRGAAQEITERKLERRDREQVMPRKAAQAERGSGRTTARAQPSRPIEATQAVSVPDGPAPGESAAHFAWRQLTVNRIQKNQAREAQRSADEIPRILRTETNPIDRAQELKAAYARQEAEQGRRAALEAAKEQVKPNKEVEIER